MLHSVQTLHFHLHIFYSWACLFHQLILFISFLILYHISIWKTNFSSDYFAQQLCYFILLFQFKNKLIFFSFVAFRSFRALLFLSESCQYQHLFWSLQLSLNQYQQFMLWQLEMTSLTFDFKSCLIRSCLKWHVFSKKQCSLSHFLQSEIETWNMIYFQIEIIIWSNKAIEQSNLMKKLFFRLKYNMR